MHYGRIDLLRRVRALGDYLVVALSTDEFNKGKGKRCQFPYEERKHLLETVRYVDPAIPEESWEQKADGVRLRCINTVVMGDDWEGSERFGYLRDLCDVVYLPKAPEIRTTRIKDDLGMGAEGEA